MISLSSKMHREVGRAKDLSAPWYKRSFNTVYTAARHKVIYQPDESTLRCTLSFRPCLRLTSPFFRFSYKNSTRMHAACPAHLILLNMI